MSLSSDMMLYQRREEHALLRQHHVMTKPSEGEGGTNQYSMKCARCNLISTLWDFMT